MSGTGIKICGHSSQPTMGWTRAALLGGTAWALLVAVNPAHAACTPDPVSDNAAVSCTDADHDGFQIGASNVAVTVASGAIVQGNATLGAAIRVTGNGTLTVDGNVVGGAYDGILIHQESGYDFTPSLSTVTVNEGAMLTGAAAIRLNLPTGSYFAYPPRIDLLRNSGRIVGEAGPALVTEGTQFYFTANIYTIENLEAGRIEGGIQANINSFDNEGIVDGGTRSALRLWPAYSDDIKVDNSGAITSAGSNPTVEISSYLFGGAHIATITNSGLIAATGDAAALRADDFVLTNVAGGVIRAAGGTAIIKSGWRAEIINAGSIEGDIRLDAAQLEYFYGGDSFTQLMGGTVAGSVIFGPGADRFVADYGSDGHFVTGVSGTIDGGNGVDTLVLRLTSSGNVTLPALPTNFENYGFDLDGDGDDPIITIGSPGAVVGSGIVLEGRGTVTLLADFAAGGRTVLNASGSLLNVINRGTLTGSGLLFGTSPYGSAIAGSFTNEGTIRIDGYDYGAISLSSSFFNEGMQRQFLNSGLITGELNSSFATAIVAAGGLDIENSGVISFVEGSGRALQIDGQTLRNSGTIEAGTRAIFGNGRIINSGTISAPGGNAVEGDWGRYFHIANTGHIDGDIVMTSNYGWGADNDIFYAGPGGSVTGSVSLGGGDDMFIVGLSEAANPTASVSGGVDAGAGMDMIRFVADRSSSATITTAAGFERVGYEAAGVDTLLTLTSPGVLTNMLYLSGDGKIELNADFNVIDQPAITVDSSSVARLFGTAPNDSSVENGPGVVSLGDLRLTETPMPYAPDRAAVIVGSHGSFENAGTITLVDAGNVGPSMKAIRGETGAYILNSGRIALSGATIGISASQVVNSGTIEQAQPGNGLAILLQPGTLDNSGVIRGGQTAVSVTGSAEILNKGVIESSGGISVSGVAIISMTDSKMVIRNLAGGQILAQEGGAAIVGNRGVDIIDNAGMIHGPVSLGSGDDIFIARGGTVQGSVDLDYGDDSVLIAAGSQSGVSGTITLGYGANAFGYLVDTSGEVMLEKPEGYELQAVGVEGIDTHVTLTAAAPVDHGLRIFGHGIVENKANIGTSDYGTAIDLRVLPDQDGAALQFVNRAAISAAGSAVVGAGSWWSTETPRISRFENSGTIDAGSIAVRIGTNVGADGLNFVNSGAIRAEGSEALALATFVIEPNDQISTMPLVQIQNSGTITNTDSFDGVAAAFNVEDVEFRLTNGGAIKAARAGLSVTGSNIELTNTGQITATGAGGYAIRIAAHLDDETEDEVSAPLAVVAHLSNAGLIEANAGGHRAPQGFYQPIRLAAGFVAAIGEGAAVELTNHAGGSIEAKGAGSIAVTIVGDAHAAAHAFTLTNHGSIVGTTGTTFAPSAGVLAVGEYFPPINLSDNPFVAGAIHTFDSTDNVHNAADGIIIGSIDLGSGDDRIENWGKINGDVFLRDGDDIFVLGLNAGFTGTASGGGGEDSLMIDTTGGGSIDAKLFDRFIDFENLALIGTGQIKASGVLPLQTVELVTGGLAVGVGETLQTLGPVAITGGSNADTVANGGTIVGDILLGGGNDRFSAAVGSSVIGSVSGGDGMDALALGFSGTAVEPTLLDLSQYDSFEQLEVSAGVAAVAGTLTLDQIAISGGRLIGHAGSVITAGTVTVASAATFGSAGLVNGNIAVAGTLSPGASPGTMTVNGNVSLAGSSTTLFELTPTVSDQLLISGTLSIETGAALTLTGERPLTPGSAYDLIVADGGITGSFTTINKPASILGFVAQRGNRVQLLGQFANSASFSPQVRASIDYVNAVLVAGQGNQSLYNALPNLLTAQGASSPAAFGQLTPETYASATQIGLEHGLLLVDAMRGHQGGARAQAGAFGFAQVLGGWRDLDASERAGTAAADVDSRGVLGGLGIGSENGAEVGIFIGQLDSKQSTALGRTDADGLVGGAFAAARFGSLGLSAMVVYDGSEAKTTRALSTGSTSSRYDLGGWTADVSADYRTELSASWSLIPSVGVSYIRVKRDGAVETGTGPFGLTVASASTGYWFADAGLGFAGRFGDVDGPTWSPFGKVGLRHILSGEDVSATGRFTGMTASMLRVAGAERSRASATLNAGIRVDLTDGISLFGAYNGELAGKSDRHGLTGGLAARF